MARAAAPKHRRRWGLLALTVAIAAGLLVWASWSLTPQNDSVGTTALDHVKALVAFGPRPSGSAAHQQMERYIVQQLQQAGAAVEQDSFVAQTPAGAVPMNNIIARIGKQGGSGGRIFVLASHYDTKPEKDFAFVGANDGGSSTGVLLALAPLLAKRNWNHQVWLVFLDGEEAVCAGWDDCSKPGEPDHTYGSLQLAAKWKADGTLNRIGAFILLDMIGDADLGLLRDANSTPWLRDEVWAVAQRLGYSRNFPSQGAPIEDDHIPFLSDGVPSVDLIDLSYGPNNRYWHTADDTVDKLSAHSMQIVSDVVLESLSELDRQQ